MKNQIVMCNTKIMTTQKAIRVILLEEKFARVGSFLIEKKRIHGRELHRNLCLRFQSCLQKTQTIIWNIYYQKAIMSMSW